MNRINKLFAEKKNNILSVYFTAGYPTLNDTVTIIKELEANGVDMLEIGIPFSDPMADGPTIQASGNVALKNGMSLEKLFNQLNDIRQQASIPLIMMGYLNPIMQYGFEAFCKKCHKIGIDGVIIPDLPFDDFITDYKPIAERYNVKVIMLITPATSEERIRLIDGNTDSFIYMVSSASVTGAQKEFDEAKLNYFRKVNSMQLKNPRLIGFGISNKQTLDAAFQNSSGGIIGSKFISLLQDKDSIKSAVKALIKALTI